MDDLMMDILQVPTEDDLKYAKMAQYFLSAKTDSNGIATIVFKKDTPKAILKSFKENIDLIPYKVHEHYVLEK